MNPFRALKVGPCERPRIQPPQDARPFAKSEGLFRVQVRQGKPGSWMAEQPQHGGAIEIRSQQIQQHGPRFPEQAGRPSGVGLEGEGQLVGGFKGGPQMLEVGIGFGDGNDHGDIRETQGPPGLSGGLQQPPDFRGYHFSFAPRARGGKHPKAPILVRREGFKELWRSARANVVLERSQERVPAGRFKSGFVLSIGKVVKPGHEIPPWPPPKAQRRMTLLPFSPFEKSLSRAMVRPKFLTGIKNEKGDGAPFLEGLQQMQVGRGQGVEAEDEGVFGPGQQGGGSGQVCGTKKPRRDQVPVHRREEPALPCGLSRVRSLSPRAHPGGTMQGVVEKEARQALGQWQGLRIFPLLVQVGRERPFHLLGLEPRQEAAGENLWGPQGPLSGLQGLGEQGLQVMKLQVGRGPQAIGQTLAHEALHQGIRHDDGHGRPEPLARLARRHTLRQGL